MTSEVSFIRDHSIVFPSDIAITPDGTTAFVTNAKLHVVAVIDTATNTVRAAVRLPEPALGVAISPDGNVAYVTIPNGARDNNVAVIDTQTLSVSFVEDLSPSQGGPTLLRPQYVCFSPDGTTAYVTDKLATKLTGSVSIIDVASASVTGIVTDSNDTFDSPEGISITPDGRTLYVANNLSSGTSSISIISTLNKAVSNSIDGFSSPFASLVARDGNACYITVGDPISIAKINTSDNSVAGTIYVENTPSGLAMGTDQSIYIANLNNSVSVFSNTTFSITGTFDLGSPGKELASSIAVLPLLPPVSLTGCQQKNVFFTQTDLVNILSWSAPPSYGVAPTIYTIYRNDGTSTEFVASVPASTLTYEDHNRKKGITYTYYVYSSNQYGALSQPVSVTITQSCPKKS